MDLNAQLTQLFEKLEAMDPEFTVFGARSHKYEFGQKLSKDDIAAFEKQHGCTLPDDYKTYFLEFGNGGAGPSYGLFALGTMDDGFDQNPWPDYIKPGAPFPYTEAYNNEEILYVGEPDEDDFDDEDEYEDAHELWYEEIGEENQNRYYAAHALDGAIPICHHGCASRSWLVIDKNSSEFGNIWNDLTGDSEGVAPALNKDGERIDFADWILDWCRKSIAELG